MRKLATVRTIDDVLQIEGSDNLELAVFGGWQAVVLKGQYKKGEQAIYCEVDSFMPIEPQYEFLRKSSYKKMWDGTEGFRIKTIRLRGQLSQGLVLPISAAHDAFPKPWLEIYEEHFGHPHAFNEGDDVTGLLGIVKWDTPPPGIFMGQGKGGLPTNAKGSFPDWLPKTDEERIQNCWNMLPKNIEYVETEKLHGTSATYYLKDGVFGICSRNLDLKPEEGGLYTEMANELGIEEKMRAFFSKEGAESGVAIQGEIIGEGINKNYNHIERRKFFVFNVFSSLANGYFDHQCAHAATGSMGLTYVPVVNEHYKLPATCAEALLGVEGPSTIGHQPVREGSVIRHSLPYGRRISAKLVSNQYLSKEK